MEDWLNDIALDPTNPDWDKLTYPRMVFCLSTQDGVEKGEYYEAIHFQPGMIPTLVVKDELGGTGAYFASRFEDAGMATSQVKEMQKRQKAEASIARLQHYQDDPTAGAF